MGLEVSQGLHRESLDLLHACLLQPPKGTLILLASFLGLASGVCVCVCARVHLPSVPGQEAPLASAKGASITWGSSCLASQLGLQSALEEAPHLLP